MRFHLAFFILMLTSFVLSGCFRDASDSDKAPTARQVNIQDINTPATNTPDRVNPTATASATLEPIPIVISPTSGNTLVVGGPPAEDNNTNSDESESVTTIPATATDVLPSNTPTATVPTATPTMTQISRSEATVGRPSFGDTGISPTPSSTFTPTQEVLATPTEIVPLDACIYLVQGGDTILAIAEELEISTEELYNSNPELRLNPDSLQVGQQIRIPGCLSDTEQGQSDSGNSSTENISPTSAAPSGTIIHIIVSGDTLFSLAQQYGTTVDAIVAANENLVTENTPIFAGDELIIPVSE